jgi:hypothetical protein
VQDRELVAAKSGDGIGFGYRGAQALRHAFQQLVPDRMAKRIVDRLEQVEIEHEDAEAFAALPQARQGFVHRFPKQRAVGQVRQRVVARQMRDAGCGPAPLGDVLVSAHPAAARYGKIDDGDHPTVFRVRLGGKHLPACQVRKQILEVAIYPG